MNAPLTGEVRTAIALRVPIELRERITARAAAEQKSLNQVMIEALEESFGDDDAA